MWPLKKMCSSTFCKVDMLSDLHVSKFYCFRYKASWHLRVALEKEIIIKICKFHNLRSCKYKYSDTCWFLKKKLICGIILKSEFPAWCITYQLVNSSIQQNYITVCFSFTINTRYIYHHNLEMSTCWTGKETKET